MHWFTALLTQIRHNKRVDLDLSDMSERVHRLEIANNQLRERLNDLEGRHDSLSHSVRGRLGGRRPAAEALSVVQTPIPLGAQQFNQR